MDLLHHVHPFAIRTYPGGTIADAPLVLIETLWANFKPANTTPTKRFFLLAAMTLEIL